jgi:hypothetical protein
MLCTVGLEVYKGMISCYELNNHFLHAHLMQTLLPMYGGFVNYLVPIPPITWTAMYSVMQCIYN